MVLTGRVILHDHVIKGSFDFRDTILEKIY